MPSRRQDSPISLACHVKEERRYIHKYFCNNELFPPPRLIIVALSRSSILSLENVNFVRREHFDIFVTS